MSLVADEKTTLPEQLEKPICNIVRTNIDISLVFTLKLMIYYYKKGSVPSIIVFLGFIFHVDANIVNG